MDEIIAISPDTVFISGKALTEDDALGAVEDVLHDLNTTGNMENVDTAIDTLLGLQRLSGKSLAKVMYGYEKWWNEHHTEKDTFKYHMKTRHGMNTTVVDRYITVWECLDTKQIPADVAVRPMRELIPIAKTLSHGYTIDQRQWNKIVKANGLVEIGAILRKVKKVKARKSSMQITWQRDGSLNAWKDNKKHFLGWLDKEAYENDPDAKKAIDRILDSAGVIRK